MILKSYKKGGSSLDWTIKKNLFSPDCSYTVHKTLGTSSDRKIYFQGGHKPNFFYIYSKFVQIARVFLNSKNDLFIKIVSLFLQQKFDFNS